MFYYNPHRAFDYNFSADRYHLRRRMEREEEIRRQQLERRRQLLEMQAEEEALRRQYRRRLQLEQQQGRAERLHQQQVQRQRVFKKLTAAAEVIQVHYRAHLSKLHSAACTIQTKFQQRLQHRAAILIQAYARAHADRRVCQALLKLQRINSKFKSFVEMIGPHTFDRNHCTKQVLVFVESVMPLVLQVDGITVPRIRDARKQLIKAMNSMMDLAEQRANELNHTQEDMDAYSGSITEGIEDMVVV